VLRGTQGGSANAIAATRGIYTSPIFYLAIQSLADVSEAKQSARMATAFQKSTAPGSICVRDAMIRMLLVLRIMADAELEFASIGPISTIFLLTWGHVHRPAIPLIGSMSMGTTNRAIADGQTANNKTGIGDSIIT
jgi:hypothetical protein